MRYLITTALVLTSIFGLASLTSSVGATSSVSWEARIVTQKKVKPNPKTTYTTLKREILAKIAKVKLEIAKLNSQIDYVQKKIDSRAKLGLDNSVFQKKLIVLTAAKKKWEDDLAYLKKKLTETEALLSK